MIILPSKCLIRFLNKEAKGKDELIENLRRNAADLTATQTVAQQQHERELEKHNTAHSNQVSLRACESDAHIALKFEIESCSCQTLNAALKCFAASTPSWKNLSLRRFDCSRPECVVFTAAWSSTQPASLVELVLDDRVRWSSDWLIWPLRWTRKSGSTRCTSASWNDET